MRPEASAVRPEASAVRPEASAVRPEASAVRPEASAGAPFEVDAEPLHFSVASAQELGAAVLVAHQGYPNPRASGRTVEGLEQELGPD